MPIRIPRPALVLALAGLVPFVVLAAAIWLVPSDVAPVMLAFQLAWTAVNIAFLGAVHWGVALARPDALGWPRLAWSVLPAVLGFLAQFMTTAPALLTLILCVWLSFVVDARAAAAGLLPGWYVQLRRLTAPVVVLSLGATLLAVLI
ncbi:MAG TPA: DUF3429 domain-containing protein [Alphaproteobacteria bacterium]